MIKKIAGCVQQQLYKDNEVQRLGTGSVLPESHIFLETALWEKKVFFVFFKTSSQRKWGSETWHWQCPSGISYFFMKLLCEKDTFSLCFRLHHRENGVQRLGTGSVLPESHIFHETALWKRYFLNFINEKMRSRDLILFSQWLVLLSLNF